MFAEISWTNYFFYLSIATVGYYIFIWVAFYKAKLPSLSPVGHLSTGSLYGEDSPDEILSTAQHIIDEIKPLFLGRRNKNELILALQSALCRYRNWDEAGFRETINDFIARESDTTCSIRLSESDFRALWSKA